jgi:hypothetical protein
MRRLPARAPVEWFLSGRVVALVDCPTPPLARMLACRPVRDIDPTVPDCSSVLSVVSLTFWIFCNAVSVVFVAGLLCDITSYNADPWSIGRKKG